jgi:hypothetical protein
MIPLSMVESGVPLQSHKCVLHPQESRDGSSGFGGGHQTHPHPWPGHLCLGAYVKLTMYDKSQPTPWVSAQRLCSFVSTWPIQSSHTMPSLNRNASGLYTPVLSSRLGITATPPPHSLPSADLKFSGPSQNSSPVFKPP